MEKFEEVRFVEARRVSVQFEYFWAIEFAGRIRRIVIITVTCSFFGEFKLISTSGSDATRVENGNLSRPSVDQKTNSL